MADRPQRGRAPALGPGSGLRAATRLEGAARPKVAVEVAGIEPLAPDHFVDSAKLADRERRWAELRRESRVLELGAGALNRILDDPFVVESQSDRTALYLRHRRQDRRSCVPAVSRRRQIGAEGQVRDRDDPHAGVAVRRAVARELLEVPSFRVRSEACLLHQLPRRGLLRSSSGCTKPPGRARAPRNGSPPRSISNTCSASRRMVKTAKSTVTANGG